MIELKIVNLMAKLNGKVQAMALASLNRRSVRNVDRYASIEAMIVSSRELLDQMETEAEARYQKADAAILKDYNAIRELTQRN